MICFTKIRIYVGIHSTISPDALLPTFNIHIVFLTTGQLISTSNSWHLTFLFIFHLITFDFSWTLKFFLLLVWFWNCVITEFMHTYVEPPDRLLAAVCGRNLRGFHALGCSVSNDFTDLWWLIAGIRVWVAYMNIINLNIHADCLKYDKCDIKNI